MLKKHAPTLRKLLSLFPQAMFCFSVILCLVTTYYVTGHYIDSDTSSNLLFAEHLSQIGKLYSRDWFYSTSIEVISSQIVFTPLFCLLDNWRYIRLIGTIILQTIYLLSYAFMIRQAGLSKRVFYISASLLLLPVSVSYGRIVLYHFYYLLLLSVGFLVLGLALRCAKVFNFKKPGSYIPVIALGILSFFGGLAGIRHLMITHAPMILAAFLFCVLDFYQNSKKVSGIFTADSMKVLLFSVFSAGASFFGFWVNSTYLSGYFSYVDYGSTTLNIIEPAQLDEILYGFFHQFGFRENVNMLSAIGILSLLGFIAGVYCVYAGIQIIKKYKKGDNIGKHVLTTFFLFFTAVTVLSFIFTGGNREYYYVLYLTFCLAWASPLLISFYEDARAKHEFTLDKAVFWITILTLCANGLANTTFFNGSKIFNQPYEGLGFQEMDKKEHISSAADYLAQNDYDIGYATYWEGSITTEITNGQVRLINIFLNEYNGNLTYYDWLNPLSLRDAECRKPFVLLESSGKFAFEASDSYPYCTLVYEDQYHCVYDILEHEAFISTLHS